MDIQAEKLELIQWLIGLKDATVIQGIKDLKKDKEEDWWNVLNEDQRADIEAGLSDLKHGKKKSFDRVVAKYK